MIRSDTGPIPPYRRIAAEIRQRITSGALRTGDRVPSTRQLVQEFGVAMATATKVLATLRQEGLVRTLPGIGTVVDAPSTHAPALRGPGQPEPGLTRQRIVDTAVGIADAEGLAALSMRRTAADLGVTTMALYRHVPGKDQLLLLIADAVFDGPLLLLSRRRRAGALSWRQPHGCSGPYISGTPGWRRSCPLPGHCCHPG
jgi:DNA-binding transcriptional MocR family regulator